MSGDNAQSADDTSLPPTPHSEDSNTKPDLNEKLAGIFDKLMISLSGAVPGMQPRPTRPADPVVSTDVTAHGSMWEPEDDEFTGMMSQYETVRGDPRGKTRVPSVEQAVENVRASNLWDPDDEEFDRWPGQKTIDRIASAYIKPRGIFQGTDRFASRAAVSTQKGSSNADSSLNTDSSKTIQAISGANLTEQEHEDLWNDLQDKECGNPDGGDTHDAVMRQFYLDVHPQLPATLPARYMHIIGHKGFSKCSDSIVRLAMPRLCDAVATVLYFTHPECLEEFLDPDVHHFEWRREGDCAMIRREGHVVTVGTYHNFGTTYVWTYFVRSNISLSGAWTDFYAAVSLITTPISRDGIEIEKSYAEPSAHGISPTDPKYALWQGRDLALFLLIHQVWSYRLHNKWSITWEADGVVTDPKVLDPLQMGALQQVDKE